MNWRRVRATAATNKRRRWWRKWWKKRCRKNRNRMACAAMNLPPRLPSSQPLHLPALQTVLPPKQRRMKSWCKV